MNCTNCGAVVPPSAPGELPSCTYCGTVAARGIGDDGVQVTGGLTGRICPVCHDSLAAGTAGRQAVEVCPRCAGLLVPMRSFARLAGYLRSVSRPLPYPPDPPDPAELDRVVHCPGCGARMDTHPYGGPGNIVIDNCRTCELNWLDHRELSRVATAPDASRAKSAWRAPGDE